MRVPNRDAVRLQVSVAIKRRTGSLGLGRYKIRSQSSAHHHNNVRCTGMDSTDSSDAFLIGMYEVSISTVYLLEYGS